MTIRACSEMAIAALLACCAAGTAAARAQTLTVKVESGEVSGIADGPDSLAWRGIPYAAPPVGVFRWMPPQPPLRWKGRRKAEEFAADCMMSLPPGRPSNDPHSEDCLYLNVWAPSRHSSARLPVMVWIFGSGFQAGSARLPQYSGKGLAGKGVVFVSMNYRLGVLGFLAHPELSAESPHRASGNYGLLDSLAAIEWVQRNIAQFGGDPHNITIFGQSSGSETVNLLTASPLARGLYQRAIGESGGAFGERQTHRLADMENIGAEYAKSLGAAGLKQLRALPAETFLGASVPRFEPVVDGWFLPMDVYDTYLAGKQNDVPMLVGSNADEGQLSTRLTRESYLSQIKVRYDSLHAAEYLAHFPAKSDDQARASQKLALTLLLGDYNSTTWARLGAASGKSRIYQYRFEHTPPESPDSGAPARHGAFHGAEIPYALANLDTQTRAWTAADRALEDILSSYWVNFAKTGDPNAASLPHWPSMQDDPSGVMQFTNDAMWSARKQSAELEFLQNFFYGASGVYGERALPTAAAPLPQRPVAK